MTRLVSFPLENAVLLLEMLCHGQLTVGKGFTGLREQSGAYAITERTDSDGSTIPVDFVINATGTPTDIRDSSDQLVQSLLADGVGMADEFGGFSVDLATGKMMTATGRTCNVVPLGTLASGAYFWTNQMNVNSRIASRQAERLAGELALAQAADGCNSVFA